MRKSTLPFWVRMFAAEVEGGGSDDEGAPEVEGGIEDPGADTGDETDGSDTDDPPNEGEVEGSDKLGDAGKKALDRMKAERNAARKALREMKAKYEPAPKEDQAADNKFAKKILRSEIKAAAAGKLADPADAHRFLDLDQFEVTEDGDVDEDEIAAAIADLIEKKPYLAATQGKRGNKGSADGGFRQESKATQLTRADLARMSPQQILKAEKEGRLNKLKGN